MSYPIYYRFKTRCLKRESDTTAVEVVIPEEEKNLPLLHHLVTFPSKERLDEEVSKMEKVDSDKYEEYLCDLFKAMDKNRKKLSEVRQARHDALYAHIPKPPHLSGSSEWKGWNPNQPKGI